MLLYNTLTDKKEEFKPLTPGEVKMYNCGPTVYNYAHIGNLRAYVFADVLRRTLEWNGYKVKQVMNITDIGHLTSDADDGEDKMTKGLKREGMPITLSAMKELGEKYTKAFLEDLKELNIKEPNGLPRASDNIPEDIEIIKLLLQKNFAYKTNDGIYFDTAKFKGYGKLGNINLTGQKEGARVAINSEKHNPADFTLWKFSTGEMGFDGQELGRGFPGWHIECSAMSRKYLGQPFDIHTGGIDHIPVHHNNEIAQSEAAFGAPLANYWMHNEHLNIAGGKMAKSGENFLTIRTIAEKGFNPLAYRYYLLGANYQTPMIFSWEAVEASQNALVRLSASLAKMPEGGKVITEYEKKFGEAINDNLNTPDGLAGLWELLRDEKISLADKLATVLKFDEVLGLNLSELISKKSQPIEISPNIATLIKERESARLAKNWKKSDELRQEIKKLGFDVSDTETGSKLEKI